MTGKIYGNFKVVEELGHGGMGIVYRGEHVYTGKSGAIKVIHPTYSQNEKFIERFKREAGALQDLHESHIVQIYDMGEIEGTYYLTMEYMEGGSLIEWRKKCHELSVGHPERPIVDQIVKVISQICEGLEYAHKKGYIHRDIKPSNILFDREGTAKISDFGLVKMLGTELSSMGGFLSNQSIKSLGNKVTDPRMSLAGNQLSLTGTPIGTYDYMSPEQREGVKEIDGRSDIYSLGVLFYELLTGKLPLGRVRSPSEINQTVHKELDEVIFKCLEQNCEERYSNMIGLIISIKRFLDDIDSGMCEQKRTEIQKENLNLDQAKETKKKSSSISRSSDGRYEVYRLKGNKVIRDTKTGLIWTPDIGKKGLNWKQTKAAVEELNQQGYGGYTDWRMPTLEDLRGICEKVKSHKTLHYDGDINIDPVFDFSGYWAWSSIIRDSSSAWEFDFYYGDKNWFNRSNNNKYFRVLAVRS